MSARNTTGLESALIEINNKFPYASSATEYAKREYLCRLLKSLMDELMSDSFGYETSFKPVAAIQELMIAIHDIDYNGVTPKLFKPSVKKNGGKANTQLWLRRYLVKHAIDYIIKSRIEPMSVSEAGRLVAKKLEINPASIESDLKKLKHDKTSSTPEFKLQDIKSTDDLNGVIAYLKTLYLSAETTTIGT